MKKKYLTVVSQLVEGVRLVNGERPTEGVRFVNRGVG